ncbi:MAG: hypothetical protein ACLSVD_03350 [Eggerthellaceae bacterium]
MEGGGQFYVNVGGNIKRTSPSTCATWPRCQPGDDDGVLVRHRIALRPGGRHGYRCRPWWRCNTDLEDGVNTITAYGADLRPAAAALRAGEERLLAYQVNGQGWRRHRVEPAAVDARPWRALHARHREHRLTQEDAEPDVQQVDPCYRNKINIVNYSDDCVFKAGDEIVRAWPTIWEAPSPPSVLIRQRPHMGVVRPTAPRPTK